MILNNAYLEGGVYQIYCTINCKKYIGSSKVIIHRVANHISLLNMGLHPIKQLQEDWSSYGKDSFEFSILEKVSNSKLRSKKETTIINRSKNVYNLKKLGGKRSSPLTMEQLLQIDYLTSGEAAKLHNMQGPHFMYYVRTGRGPDGEKRGRWWFFPKEEVLKWEKPEPDIRGPRLYK